MVTVCYFEAILGKLIVECGLVESMHRSLWPSDAGMVIYYTLVTSITVENLAFEGDYSVSGLLDFDTFVFCVDIGTCCHLLQGSRNGSTSSFWVTPASNPSLQEMEAACFSETSVSTLKSAQCQDQVHQSSNSLHHENPKIHVDIISFLLFKMAAF
jgi:hypothetical protein